jgi:hypothetical protein
MMQNGSMPRALTEKNISLFTAEVLPRLRPIWDEEGWQHHWWPGEGAKAAAGATAAGAATAGAVGAAAAGTEAEAR